MNYNNPFQDISEKLDKVLTKIDALENKANNKPMRISFPDFCNQQQVTRATVYSWADKGLIELEKVGGRQFIKTDSIRITKKYQRA